MSLGATGLAFASLAARADGEGPLLAASRAAAGYGPLSPKTDLSTGLKLLALPDGFEYLSFGWTGQIMDDRRPTPTNHDGMAVCAGRDGIIALVRNHELTAGEGPRCFVEGGMYDQNEIGGTTSLLFDPDRGRLVKSYTSLGGTIRNCAGGRTPWGSWLSCEETFRSWSDRPGRLNHGYIFEVPAFGISNGRPIRSAGRFSHEAVAVDPRTGNLYETEDEYESAIYKYVPPGGSGSAGSLRDGGALFAMVVDGEARKDMSGGFDLGDRFEVSWQRVEDPEAKEARAFDSASHAAVFSRGEGCWEEGGLIYFVSTNGGAEKLGQVWRYDPNTETLMLLYEARDEHVLDGPDNLTVTPRGGIVLCEDGRSRPMRLVGLTVAGAAFTFAENRIDLKRGDIDVIDAAFPGAAANLWYEAEGDFSGEEWAGATCHGDWLFANVQRPGVTFAIRGPWGTGGL